MRMENMRLRLRLAEAGIQPLGAAKWRLVLAAKMGRNDVLSLQTWELNHKLTFKHPKMDENGIYGC
jgi:hypothetical protein